MVRNGNPEIPNRNRQRKTERRYFPRNRVQQLLMARLSDAEGQVLKVAAPVLHGDGCQPGLHHDPVRPGTVQFGQRALVRGAVLRGELHGNSGMIAGSRSLPGQRPLASLQPGPDPGPSSHLHPASHPSRTGKPLCTTERDGSATRVLRTPGPSLPLGPGGTQARRDRRRSRVGALPETAGLPFCG